MKVCWHHSTLGELSVFYPCQSFILILVPCWVAEAAGMKQRKEKKPSQLPASDHGLVQGD